MGNLLRLVVFVFALAALAAGTGALLLRERQREQAVERLLRSSAEESPASVKTLRSHHRSAQQGIVLFGGLALVCVIVLAVTPGRADPALEAPERTAARSEMRGLETLARATAAQRVELDQEREARHRSEQNLNLQQLLTNHTLQDKIRLGRDLHDGLVQTLYATGLVLETAVQRLSATPPAATDAARLIERAKTTLNAAIRQARDTIDDLSPDALEQQSFPQAVDALLDHLDGERLRERQVTLSPELPVFSEPQRTELLQIIREAVSNALRHGAATRLNIEFAPLPDQRLRLEIRDDGTGFDPAAITRGHGLDNLAARARAVGAALDIDSAPGRGTRIVITLPKPIRSE